MIVTLPGLTFFVVFSVMAFVTTYPLLAYHPEAPKRVQLCLNFLIPTLLVLSIVSIIFGVAVYGD